MSAWELVAAFVAGGFAGALGIRLYGRRQMAAAGPELLPAEVPHLLDLVRRAHGGAAVCLVVPDGDPIWAVADQAPAPSLLERARAVASLALNDARDHIIREGQAIVASGDGELGMAVVLGFDHVSDRAEQDVITDLRRVLAEVGVERRREFGRLRDPRRTADWVADGAESLEGLAFALSERVLSMTGRPAAVVVRAPGVPAPATIVAVSQGADRRLIGRPVSADSATGRAVMGDVPVVGSGSQDLFGRGQQDRRRQVEEGIAFPIRTGREGVGALVVFGSHLTLADEDRDRLTWLCTDVADPLAAAAQVREAENRATTDVLTGLPNRRALERAVNNYGDGPCALLMVDVDHFKKLNDGFGHQGGDIALKHVARVFKGALREDDLAARVGGEEFALWLPGAALSPALEVAERVRTAVSRFPVPLGDSEVRISCSIGVAAVPEIVGDPNNLYAAADAALYQAKAQGRNRVQAAAPK